MYKKTQHSNHASNHIQANEQITTSWSFKLQQTVSLVRFQVRRGAGVLASSRRIGPELSRRVHMLLTSEDGDLPMK